MTTLIGANEAARLLGVTKPTLYAYVSRGVIERQRAVDGRTSLYVREEIEELANRRGTRTPAERPSIDVQIGSSITHLSDDGVRYRGRDVADLARHQPFESVAELLWTGELPMRPPRWPIDRALLERCNRVVEASATSDPFRALALSAMVLADGGASADSAVPTARCLLAIAPSVLGGPIRGTTAARLASAYVRRPADLLVEAVDRALVLLADHELATSTLAVRVAASVRPGPASALATGLLTVGGRLHGRAASGTTDLFREAADVGARTAIHRRLDRGELLPGFGHSVYRNGDPRLAPLLEVVAELPDPDSRHATVDDVLTEAGLAIGHLPNVDFGLGALIFVAGLPDDIALFAVARIAGWAAHHDEELTERPVRYRGLTKNR
jgi:citrate synthase